MSFRKMQKTIKQEWSALDNKEPYNEQALADYRDFKKLLRLWKM